MATPPAKPGAAAPAPDDGDVLSPQVMELLNNIHNLSDDDLDTLRDLILAEVDNVAPDPTAVVASGEVAQLTALADAATAVKTEFTRRADGRVAVDAARATVASLRVPTDRRPRYSTQPRATAITAGGNPIPDGAALSSEFISALRSQRAPGRDGRTIVATLHSGSNAPLLRTTDSAEAVTAALAASATAITAAGGLGGAEQVDYALNGFGETPDRPVKAALPSFVTERGGIRFMRELSVADLTGSASVWNIAQDIAAVTDPAVRKPSLRVPLGQEVVADVQAITSILTFGNMQARAYPEFIDRCLNLSLVAHARLAEVQLLAQIDALATPVTVGASTLGATRQILPVIERAVVAMRSRGRLSPTTPMTCILPDWTRALLRADLTEQMPGDDELATADAELDSWFAMRGVNAVFSLDMQMFGAQASGAALLDYASSVTAFVFPTGAYNFLDGGTLDLGLVRDSVLNAANDYQMFMETFECVILRGGNPLRLTIPVSASGVSRAAA